MRAQRVGVYGGTFDPIHNGHLAVARAAGSFLKLDELLIVPAYRPPHKSQQVISETFHRYTMAAIAILEDPAIRVSTIELEAPDKPYTFETLARLRERYEPDTKLFFLMGADSFLELNTWREPERLLKEASIVVAARPGSDMRWDHLEEPLSSRVRDTRNISLSDPSSLDSGENMILLTELVLEDISATEIRDKVGRGESIKGLVPEPVAAYINKYELYRR